jgi:hypothetical protein
MNLKECDKVSENEGSITIKFDKKMAMLFVVIVVAIATGLFVYNNVLQPAADTAADKADQVVSSIKEDAKRAAVRASLLRACNNAGDKNPVIDFVDHDRARQWIVDNDPSWLEHFDFWSSRMEERSDAVTYYAIVRWNGKAQSTVNAYADGGDILSTLNCGR